MSPEDYRWARDFAAAFEREQLEALTNEARGFGITRVETARYWRHDEAEWQWAVSLCKGPRDVAYGRADDELGAFRDAMEQLRNREGV